MSKQQPAPAQPPVNAAGSSTAPAAQAASHLQHHNSHDDELPGYSEPSASFVNHSTTTVYRHLLNSIPGVPAVDLTGYWIRDSSISKDQTTVTIANPVLCTDAAALTQFVMEQAALPPRPQVRITGSNRDSYDFEFDIRLNVMHYLLRPAGQTQWNYMKFVEPNEMAFRGGSSKSVKPHAAGGLPDWAKMFCKNSATNKAFVLEREVPNWNTSLLEGRIRTLIAKMQYQGRIEITFPVSHSTVVIIPTPPPSGVLPRLMSLFTETKKYAVARSIWPYANMAASTLSTAMEDRGGARRLCAVQSEEEWWEVWGSPIANAIREKRRGWVSIEDVLDVIIVPKTISD